MEVEALYCCIGYEIGPQVMDRDNLSEPAGNNMMRCAEHSFPFRNRKFEVAVNEPLDGTNQGKICSCGERCGSKNGVDSVRRDIACGNNSFASTTPCKDSSHDLVSMGFQAAVA